jgi:hypothetical protein
MSRPAVLLGALVIGWTGCAATGPVHGPPGSADDPGEPAPPPVMPSARAEAGAAPPVAVPASPAPPDGAAAPAGRIPDAAAAAPDTVPAAPAPTGDRFQPVWSLPVGQVLEVAVPPASGDSYESAQFSLFLPEGLDFVRGIVIHQHGCGRNGITMPHDLQWRSLAAKWGFALLGSLLKDCIPWTQPRKSGTGPAMLKALAQLATMTRHPELVEAPWIVWGHSGGAAWALNVTGVYRDRVIAAFPFAVPAHALETTPPDWARVPLLLATGTSDSLFESTTGLWRTMHATAGLLAGLAVEPRGTHSAAQTRPLAIRFIDDVIPLRMPAGADPRQGKVALRELAPGSGWVADEAGAIRAAGATGAGRGSWFPTERVARAWEEFSRTARVRDTTAPDRSPVKVQAVAQGRQVTMTWAAYADLESGVTAFRIYRDGAMVAEQRSPSSGGFQTPNFGDEPSPGQIPAMRFVDQGVAPGAHRYEVTIVNGIGMESPRSAAANVTVD